jgi:hypothetical protein
MKYQGVLFDKLEETGKVKSAVLAPERVAIDWRESEGDFHLIATSDDGCHYRGNYGEPKPDPDLHMDLALFKASTGAVLLMGKWWNEESGDEGRVIFHLLTDAAAVIAGNPETEEPPAKKTRKKKGG